MTDERGQTTVLIVGLATVLLMAIAVVVDASAAFLQRQGLAAVADGAALAGADAGAADLDTLYSEGVAAAPRLDQAASVARAAVVDHLRSTGAYDEYPGLIVDVTVTGTTVAVEVDAPLDLPFTLPGSPATAVIGANASAVVVVD